MLQPWRIQTCADFLLEQAATDQRLTLQRIWRRPTHDQQVRQGDRGIEVLTDCREVDVFAQLVFEDFKSDGPHFSKAAVETPEGRDEYQRRQREMSARAGVLRARLIDSVSGIVTPF